MTMATSTIKGISETTATASSGYTLTENRIVRKGNLLRIRLEVRGNTSANDYRTVATLPEGYRPKVRTVKAIVPMAGTTGYLRIQPTGAVDIYPLATIGQVYIDETILDA